MKNYKKGQTLIEVAIAMGVASIVIVAIVILAANALRNAQDSIRRSESTKIANAGVEAVIYYRNINGFEDSSFPQSAGDSFCYSINASSVLEKIPNPADCVVTVVSPSTGLDYTREITLEKIDPDTYELTSTVNWEVSNSKINSVSIKRILTNWQ